MWFHNNYTRKDSRYKFAYIQNEFDSFGTKTQKERMLQGSMNKSMGQCKGISDAIIFSPGASTIFIEFKIGKNKQSKAQVEFEADITNAGFNYFVVYTEKEFQEIINKHVTI